jgi:hypothetical protein
MSLLGHSQQTVAHGKSLHVRCSPKATQSQSLDICREGVNGGGRREPLQRPVMMVARFYRSDVTALAVRDGVPPSERHHGRRAKETVEPIVVEVHTQAMTDEPRRRENTARNEARRSM